ncbi:MAG: nitrate/nitrite transporter NrtS [Methylophaga sp.]|nr:nitrate/nitrite transporter NrtS [Methylophaga sp.]
MRANAGNLFMIKQKKNQTGFVSIDWINPRVIKRSFVVALVVGTILNLINHHDLFFGATLSLSTAIKIVLTYMVPYFVSTHGQVCGHFDNASESLKMK